MGLHFQSRALIGFLILLASMKLWPGFVGGLSFFASLGLLAVWNDNASTIPFAPKVYPYYNLRVELGGEP